MSRETQPRPDCIPVADKRKTLESLARELRALGVRPEDVLYRAVLGERVAHACGPALRPLDALRRDVIALHSPSVLEVLHVAATACRYAFLNGPLQAGETPVEARERETKLPQTLLIEVSAALRKPDPVIGDLESIFRITRALAHAKAVQTAAEKKAAQSPSSRRSDGRPSNAAISQARRKVAKKANLSVAAMQLRISRAFDAAPNAGWPEIMPRPPKRQRS